MKRSLRSCMSMQNSRRSPAATCDAGVTFAIDSDAHSVSDLGNMPYGVGTAQRGWLTPDDVINTWPLDRLRAFLRKGRGA
jgi:histidinol phosphatase-like PHP family hydrolase